MLIRLTTPHDRIAFVTIPQSAPPLVDHEALGEAIDRRTSDVFMTAERTALITVRDRRGGGPNLVGIVAGQSPEHGVCIDLGYVDEHSLVALGYAAAFLGGETVGADQPETFAACEHAWSQRAGALDEAQATAAWQHAIEDVGEHAGAALARRGGTLDPTMESRICRWHRREDQRLRCAAWHRAREAGFAAAFAPPPPGLPPEAGGVESA